MSSSAANDSLGTCPRCDARIPARNRLISYETADGDRAVYAECPDCSDPVHPD
jgi:hypothetical protein